MIACGRASGQPAAPGDRPFRYAKPPAALGQPRRLFSGHEVSGPFRDPEQLRQSRAFHLETGGCRLRVHRGRATSPSTHIESIESQRGVVSEVSWPPVTNQTRGRGRGGGGWAARSTRRTDRELESLRAAGLGGVEITPIYGVSGARPVRPVSFGRWCGCSSTRCVKRGGSISASTWPPAPAGRSAGRGLATATPPVAGVSDLDRRGGQRLAEPVRFEQPALVRAIGNQIYECSKSDRAKQARRARGRRRDARWSGREIADHRSRGTGGGECQPAGARARAGALTRTAAAACARRLLGAGAIVDLTPRVAATARSTGSRRRNAGRSTAFSRLARQDGRARRARRRRQRHRSLLARRHPRLSGAIRSAFAGRSLTGCAPSSTTRTRWTTPTGQANGTPLLFDEFQRRRGYDLRRHLPALFGADTGDAATRGCSPTTGRRSPISCSRPSPTDGAHGRAGAAPSCGTRRTGRPATCSTSTPRAISLRPRGPTSRASSGRPPRACRGPAARLGGSGDVARRALPVDARRRPRRRRSLLRRRRQPHRLSRHRLLAAAASRGPDGSSTRRSNSTRAIPGGTTSRALNEYVDAHPVVPAVGRAGSRRAACTSRSTKHWRARGNGLLTHFGGANPPTEGTAFEAAAATLERRGFTYDYISDRLLQSVRVDRRTLVTSGGGSYRALVVPSSRFIPIDTLRTRPGARARRRRGRRLGAGRRTFRGRRPRAACAPRSCAMAARSVAPMPTAATARLGRGRCSAATTSSALLARAGVSREPLVDRGLMFAPAHRRLAGSISSSTAATARSMAGCRSTTARRAAIVFDPMTGRRGVARRPARRAPARWRSICDSARRSR